MNSFITYEVSERPNDFKAEMIRHGYFDAWNSNGVRYELPNSTLWKPDIELAAAFAEINTALNALNTQYNWNIRLVRCIVLSNSPWIGIVGERRN